MDTQKNEDIPLVYSCSGCSSAAQMANYIAVQLDRRQLAEMSCIAGVGGHVKPLVRTAKSGRFIIGIDGCALSCVRSCLLQHGLEPQYHIDLSQLGVRKMKHSDFSQHSAEAVLHSIVDQLKIHNRESEKQLHKPGPAIHKAG